jgi:hypothetical protein
MGHRLFRMVYTLQYKWVCGFFPFLHFLLAWTQILLLLIGYYCPQLAAFSQWSNTSLVDGLNEVKLILNTRWGHNNSVCFTLKPNYFLACHDIFVSHFMCSFYSKPSQTKLERCDCTKAVNKQQRLHTVLLKPTHPKLELKQPCRTSGLVFFHKFFAIGGRSANKFLKLKIRKSGNICGLKFFLDLQTFRKFSSLRICDLQTIYFCDLWVCDLRTQLYFAST